MVRPSMTMEMTTRPTAPFGGAKGDIALRVKKFQRQMRQIGKDAAAEATRVSRANVRYLRPFEGAQRRGRTSTGGRLASFIHWSPVAGGVGLDVDLLDQHAPHWVIQEIGTGQRALMRSAGDKKEPGRPKSSDARLVTVKSQRGRRISGALVFADGPGGRYSPPGSAVGQQLYLRSQVTGAPSRRGSSGIIIKREIRGQHFIKKGSEAGFRQYREAVHAAARNSFRKNALS